MKKAFCILMVFTIILLSGCESIDMERVADKGKDYLRTTQEKVKQEVKEQVKKELPEQTMLSFMMMYLTPQYILRIIWR